VALSRKTAARSSAPAARGARARVLRIIGGTWRGRRLRFPAGALIRPTPDRVRETLFNWLGARVPGARCLDLFAGSGALGLEALSRGAAHVTFVERDAGAVRELRARLAEWGARDALVERGDALAFLAQRAHPFDIVFLDPPFASGLLAVAAAAWWLFVARSAIPHDKDLEAALNGIAADYRRVIVLMDGADTLDEATRARIIETAIRIFGKRGLAAPTVEEIAAEAEVGKGTIYNYFATKEEIVELYRKAL
jgi:16S rRNA (guanine966-N2)-methyltransferase